MIQKTEKPACTCSHPHAAHQLGICAFNRGKGIPDSCWCDSYEPNDAEQRSRFPVEPIPYREEGE